MTGLPGINLKNIYIINGEYFSLEQLSAEQQKQIEENGDRRAYSAYRSTLLEAYGEDLEANIFINTDRVPHELKVFDKNNQALTRERRQLR